MEAVLFGGSAMVVTVRPSRPNSEPLLYASMGNTGAKVGRRTARIACLVWANAIGELEGGFNDGNDWKNK